jgi:hypothetical protein
VIHRFFTAQESLPQVDRLSAHRLPSRQVPAPMFLMLPSANTYGGQCTVSLASNLRRAVHLFNQFKSEPEPNKGNQECNN